MDIQIEATEAVNSIYNFDFEAADKEFRWLRYEYPKHPLPYFLLGFAEWWKMMPNPDVKTWDKKMLNYMDTCIYYCEELLDKDDKNMDAIFFMAAASGFQARIYAEREKWSKATFAGNRAVKYINEGKDFLDMSPEFSFGQGLLNYYIEWIKENYKFLKPVLLFFPNGDTELGLKQLEYATNNAFYSRTEALFWLMFIHTNETNEYHKALTIASYLHQKYPNNAYFNRYYARLTWGKGNYSETEKVSLSILEGIEQKKTGYEEISGRYAAYYLAYINEFVHRDSKKSKFYFEKCIEFAEKIKALDSGYYIYAHIYLARISKKNGDNVAAYKYYKKYTEIATNKKDEKYNEAKAYVKNNKKAQK